ncbi:MAG: hypothetical protein V4539_00790 [Bacteroidota bacterium]
MRNVLLLVILFGTTIIACTPNGGSSKYNEGTFPTTPTNMGSINSAYDDYNSTFPFIGTSCPLVFSSNRGSQGQNFDFVFKWVDIYRDRYDGSYKIGESTDVNYLLDSYAGSANIDYAISRVNSGADELGPYLISLGSGRGQNAGTINTTVNYYAFLYASGISGNLDISYSENKTTDTHEKPVALSFLNTPKDDAYPCLTKDSGSIYFCSNRDGNFDIYKAKLPVNGNGFLASLKDSISPHPVTKDLDLSSAFDDKCPFIMGTMLIFTSNRPGGYGGFDLYYSKFENDKWSAPVNFGPTINTASDEYRPILINVGPGFTNNFMLFSSNRPGGKGGFDLYYVGIDK